MESNSIHGVLVNDALLACAYCHLGFSASSFVCPKWFSREDFLFFFHYNVQIPKTFNLTEDSSLVQCIRLKSYSWCKSVVCDRLELKTSEMTGRGFKSQRCLVMTVYRVNIRTVVSAEKRRDKEDSNTCSVPLLNPFIHKSIQFLHKFPHPILWSQARNYFRNLFPHPQTGDGNIIYFNNSYIKYIYLNYILSS